MPSEFHTFMNAKYPLLELHTGNHGAMEYCDLRRAAVKTQCAMQILFKGLKKNGGIYKTRKFKLIDCAQWPISNRE